MGVIKIIGTPLYQWELGRKISISTSEHTIINKVEFSHDGDTESLVVKPRVENDQMVVDIPNIMLLSGHYIHVYISYSDENLLETVAYDILPVIKRPKPSDYVYTETEVESYAELEARVAELEKLGGLDPETIKEAIDEYLTENPLDSKPIKGVDYFTPEEVQEIAEQAAQMVEVPEVNEGVTPHIGANGNWWIGDDDTGVFAGGVKVTGAKPGQTIVVNAVDSNGMPTSWNVADVPKGADIWEKIADVKLSEAVHSFEVSKDINGQNFELNQFIIQIITQANDYKPLWAKSTTPGGVRSIAYISSQCRVTTISQIKYGDVVLSSFGSAADGSSEVALKGYMGVGAVRNIGFQFIRDVSNPFIADTNFIIWGVRA